MATIELGKKYLTDTLTGGAEVVTVTDIVDAVELKYVCSRERGAPIVRDENRLKPLPVMGQIILAAMSIDHDGAIKRATAKVPASYFLELLLDAGKETPLGYWKRHRGTSVALSHAWARITGEIDNMLDPRKLSTTQQEELLVDLLANIENRLAKYRKE